jgi:hypothetical protein
MVLDLVLHSAQIGFLGYSSVKYGLLVCTVSDSQSKPL